MATWISVKDKNPLADETYLVYLSRPLKDGRRIVFSNWFQKQWVGINGSCWPKMPKPIYWMPLPFPPIGTEK